MPRRPRIHYPGALYHVVARGVEKRLIFLDSADYEHYTATQGRAIAKLGASLIAYCLMPNHVHLAIKVGAVPLSRIMHRILACHALTFNEKYRRVGHLFQGRHSAFLITHERYLQNLIRYIHQNPVRAKLTERAKDWRWSSCSADLREEDSLPNDFDPYFGEPEHKTTLLREISSQREPLDAIGIMIQSRTGIALGEMRSRVKRGPVVAAKTEFALAATASGYTSAETARWLGVSATAVANYLRTS